MKVKLGLSSAGRMAYLGLYLCCIILVLLLIIYFKVIYKCKHGVKISVDVLQKSDDGKENLKIREKVEVLPQPPGPIPWPILGNLALLGQFEVPFEGFSALSKIYGDVYSLTLGTTRCVVVNNLDIIKEVLNQNGKYFGGRPNFQVRKESKVSCSSGNIQEKYFFTAISQNFRWRSQ